jgi:hypothetical protein
MLFCRSVFAVALLSSAGCGSPNETTPAAQKRVQANPEPEQESKIDGADAWMKGRRFPRGRDEDTPPYDRDPDQDAADLGEPSRVLPATADAESPRRNE